MLVESEQRDGGVESLRGEHVSEGLLVLGTLPLMRLLSPLPASDYMCFF